MQKFSYHTHTNTFGIYDGKNSVEEMLSAAEALGWTEIGISNHLIYHPKVNKFTPQFFNDDAEAEDVYKKTIAEIREVASHHKIKTFVGFEVDFIMDNSWRQSFEKMMTKLDYDYLIGSSHCLYNHNATWFLNIYEMMFKNIKIDDDIKHEGIVNYWRNVVESIKSGYFDFIAHFDVLKIFGMATETEWNDDKWKIIETLAAYHHPYELNTSGWNKAGEQHPQEWTLKELNKLDVPIIISDDAHTTAMLGQHFSRAEQMLDNMGYKNRWKLQSKK